MPRIRRYFTHTCPACTTTSLLSRAVAVECPLCHAAPGTPCFDLRSREKAERLTTHPERDARITLMDAAS